MKKIYKLIKRETRKLFRIIWDPTFLYLTIVGNSLLLIAVTAVYFLEKNQSNTQMHSYFDALWWGIFTITTIGYGDILPQTVWGRIIGIALMYTGSVLFISFTGVLLSALLKEEVEGEIAPLKKEMLAEEKEQVQIEKALEEISKRLERLEKK